MLPRAASSATRAASRLGAQVMTFSAQDDPPHQVNFDVRAMHFGWTGFDMTIGGETRRINLLVLP